MQMVHKFISSGKGIFFCKIRSLSHIICIFLKNAAFRCFANKLSISQSFTMNSPFFFLIFFVHQNKIVSFLHFFVIHFAYLNSSSLISTVSSLSLTAASGAIGIGAHRWYSPIRMQRSPNGQNSVHGSGAQ